MSTLFAFRGLPASGKTTAARLLVLSGNTARVNLDEMGKSLFEGRVGPRERAFIRSLQGHIIAAALAGGWNVAVDDGTLDPCELERLGRLAERYGQGMEVVELDTPLEECIRRDSLRDNPVGEMQIRRLAAEYAQSLGVPQP